MVARLVSGRTTAILLLGGAGLLALASFLPWFRSAELGTSIVSYTGGGGVVTLGIATAIAVCTVLYLAGIDRSALKLTLLFLAAANTFVVLLDVNAYGFPWTWTGVYFSTSFDVGFYVVCLATIVLIVGAARTLRQPRGSSVAPPGIAAAGRKPMPVVVILAIVLAIPIGLVAIYIALYAVVYSISCGSGC
jgi:hypothetical protein